MPSLRIVFAGSPAAAVPSLRALIASEHEVVAVVTREPSPQGRRRILTPTPVADVAVEHGIPVIAANKLAGAATEQISGLAADLGVIVAYGGLVREPLLSAPALGWINLHFSLLPRWRGAAPVQRAIIAGDTTTGAAVFRLVEELDAGDVYDSFTEPINAFHTSGGLLETLAASGAALLARVVNGIADGTARSTPQAGDVTLAPKLTLADGDVPWASDANTVSQLIRGVTPEPGAWTTLDGVRIKILQAHGARDTPALPPGHITQEGKTILIGTATHPLELVTVQPAGRTAMKASDWWRGRPAGAAVAVAAQSAAAPRNEK
ncbi:MAG: methionyl-tRNA formyltransferase [Microbacteriaceae bacterium]